MKKTFFFFLGVLCVLGYYSCTKKMANDTDLAQANEFAVDRADAVGWLSRHLTQRSPGETTVVYHSIVWQYLDEDTQHALRSAINQAGRAATDDAPLAWLAFELGAEGQPPTLTLTLWPGGSRRLLARAHPHGAWIAWHGSPRG